MLKTNSFYNLACTFLPVVLSSLLFTPFILNSRNSAVVGIIFLSAALNPYPCIESPNFLLVFLVFVAQAGTSMSPLKKSRPHHDESQRGKEEYSFYIPPSFVFASRRTADVFLSLLATPICPITLKIEGGNERFNERNGAIDPPFILMGEQITVNYGASHLVV